MADETTTDDGEQRKKGYTPPKGRPTRARGEVDDRRRAFGPVAQWITLALALALAVWIIIAITDGGDFNPLNNDDNPFGAPTSITFE